MLCNPWPQAPERQRRAREPETQALPPQPQQHPLLTFADPLVPVAQAAATHTVSDVEVTNEVEVFVNRTASLTLFDFLELTFAVHLCGAFQANWGPPSGASMSNPFAAFSVQIGSAGVQAGLPAADPKGAVREHALALKKGESGRFSALDELPGDWWSLAENEPGGYQCRTVVQVLGRRVECMLDGCAGANHVTEELFVGMLNRAAELGIGTEDPRFPVVKLVIVLKVCWAGAMRTWPM